MKQDDSPKRDEPPKRYDPQSLTRADAREPRAAERAADRAVEVAPSRSRPWEGFFRLRYSYRSLSFDGEKTHFRAREDRFEDGRYESEEIEGTADGRTYFEAITAAQQRLFEQFHRLASLSFPWLLPPPKNPRK